MEGQKEYIQGQKYIRNNNFSEAKKCFEEASKADSLFGHLAYGGIGYCSYKLAGNRKYGEATKSFYQEAKKNYENKKLLEAASNKEFLMYLQKWVTLYYNMGLNEEYENIILSLQYYNPKKEDFDEGETCLKDNSGQSFNDHHQFIKLIKGFYFWKTKQCLEKAEQLFKEAERIGGAQFIKEIQKEKNKLEDEIKKTEKDSFCYATLKYKLGTNENLNEAIRILDKLGKKQDFDQRDYAYIYKARCKVKLLLNKKGNISSSDMNEIRESYEEGINLISKVDEENLKKKANIYLEMVNAYILLLPNYASSYDEIIMGWFNTVKDLINQENISYPDLDFTEGDYYFCIKKYGKAYKKYCDYSEKAKNAGMSRYGTLLETKIEISKHYATPEDLEDAKNEEKDNNNKERFNPQPEGNLDNEEQPSFRPESTYARRETKDITTQIRIPEGYSEKIKKLVDTAQNLKNPDLFVKLTITQGKIFLDDYKTTLFEYLHKTDYLEEQDKVFDKMPYKTKMIIIKQINNILKFFNNNSNAKDLYLTSFNFLVYDEKEITYGGAKIKYPIIKLALIPPELIIRKKEENIKYLDYLYNWNFHKDINFVDYQKEVSQFTKNLFYSYSILIWEVLTRKIPFINNKGKNTIELINGQKLIISLKKGQLRFGEMPYYVPLKVYDFIFIFLKLKEQPDFKEGEINKFFGIVESFPTDPIDYTLPNESRSEEEQAIIYSPNKYVTRFRNWNWKSFNFDKEFRGCVLSTAQNLRDDLNLVRFYGPATQGFDVDNWYFYTERLEASLAKKLENGELDEKDKIETLKNICQTVDSIVGNDYCINFLNENYIFAVNQGGILEEFKILNHGKNLKTLEQFFPNQDQVRSRNTSTSKLKSYLIEDFLCMAFRMFKDKLQGEDDAEIKKNLQETISDPNEGNKDLYEFLNYATKAYKNNLMDENGKKIDFVGILSELDKIHSFN